MGGNDLLEIEIVEHPSLKGCGVVVDGEDCFAGDVVTCESNTAKYLVALGRARYLQEPEPERAMTTGRTTSVSRKRAKPAPPAPPPPAP